MAAVAVAAAAAVAAIVIVAVAAASTLGEKGAGANVDAAVKVGKDIAAAAKKAGVSAVVFDRGGYLFHGRVKALADAAREGGLEF